MWTACTGVLGEGDREDDKAGKRKTASHVHDLNPTGSDGVHSPNHPAVGQMPAHLYPDHDAVSLETTAQFLKHGTVYFRTPEDDSQCRHVLICIERPAPTSPRGTLVSAAAVDCHCQGNRRFTGQRRNCNCRSEGPLLLAHVLQCQMAFVWTGAIGQQRTTSQTPWLDISPSRH